MKLCLLLILLIMGARLKACEEHFAGPPSIYILNQLKSRGLDVEAELNQLMIGKNHLSPMSMIDWSSEFSEIEQIFEFERYLRNTINKKEIDLKISEVNDIEGVIKEQFSELTQSYQSALYTYRKILVKKSLHINEVRIGDRIYFVRDSHNQNQMLTLNLYTESSGYTAPIIYEPYFMVGHSWSPPRKDGIHLKLKASKVKLDSWKDSELELWQLTINKAI